MRLHFEVDIPDDEDSVNATTILDALTTAFHFPQGMFGYVRMRSLNREQEEVTFENLA